LKTDPAWDLTRSTGEEYVICVAFATKFDVEMGRLELFLQPRGPVEDDGDRGGNHL
jgi:hypothetical protein